MSTRERIVTLLASLPDEVLPEVVTFIEFQWYKLAQQAANDGRPVPVKLGGIWAGVEITDEDIEAVRREMWDGIEDRWER